MFIAKVLTTAGVLAAGALATALPAHADTAAVAVPAAAAVSHHDVPDADVALPGKTPAAASARSYIWRSAISEGSGVRIRRTPVNGAVLGTMPLYARLDVACSTNAGTWYEVAYNTGKGYMLYGYSARSLIEIDPDAYIPPC